MAIKQPMGIEITNGERNAIPNNPNFDFNFTNLLFFLVNTLLGFFRLKRPVFNLNQFQNCNIPVLKNIKTMMKILWGLTLTLKNTNR